MDNNSNKTLKTLYIWSFVGLAFVILNFALALSFNRRSQELFRIVLFGASAIHLIGCIGVWIKVYPLARICWIIGGILNIPIGLIMLNGASKAKELSAKPEVSQ